MQECQTDHDKSPLDPVEAVLGSAAWLGIVAAAFLVVAVIAPSIPQVRPVASASASASTSASASAAGTPAAPPVAAVPAPIPEPGPPAVPVPAAPAPAVTAPAVPDAQDSTEPAQREPIKSKSKPEVSALIPAPASVPASSSDNVSSAERVTTSSTHAETAARGKSPVPDSQREGRRER
ncbi:MAG: hypothetical protein H7311_08795 [Ramlibacter sp.]|nr:hypothetical protein [Cryobacterium sp.]